jgi:hypothetical protein
LASGFLRAAAAAGAASTAASVTFGREERLKGDLTELLALIRPGRASQGAIIGNVASAPKPDDLAERLKAQRAHASSVEAKRIGAATQLVSTLEQMAETFEHSAKLAEREADRRAADGRDDVEEERQVAARGREAAQRARSQADEWRQHLRESD